MADRALGSGTGNGADRRAGADPADVPAQAYAARLAELNASGRTLDAASRRYSLARGVTFLVAVGGIITALLRAQATSTWVVAGGVGALFIVFVVAHASVLAKKDLVDRRIALVQRGLDRLGGKLPPLRGAAPAVADEAEPETHAYALDLDLLGSAPLLRLVDSTETPPGHATLRRWLFAPASARVIAERHAAARELAPRDRLREELAILGMRAAASRTAANEKIESDAIDPLVAWAESTSAAVSAWPARIGAAAVVLTLTLALLPVFVDDLPWAARKAWLVPFIIQVIVLGALRDAVDAIVAAATSRAAPFGRYRAMFRAIEVEAFEAPRLVALRGILGAEGSASASDEMASLERILGFADLRHSGIVHTIANLGLLWDVWMALFLDRWRRRAARRVRAWVEAIGETEALASIATFAFEHPHFTWPEVTEGDPHFSAERLGHPLIAADRRVTNDVMLTAPGRALMVTGSNMSGKSTLLRAMGVAAVLALAGAPVCAARLRISTLSVRTSMRISDSLEHGVSRFYAELQRLKAIVDAVARGERVLFLLDEILHGTNSRERIIGAKGIVRGLVDAGAIGAVSSHDIGLADLEVESGGRVENVHFEEQLDEGGRMTFDYALKPGVVRSGNALRLMRSVGLAVDLADG